MCLFCAAIPATLSGGAYAQSRRRRAREQNPPRHAASSGPRIEPLPLAVMTAFLLAIASALYHSHYGGP